MKKTQDKKRYHVSDLETLRAIADPLRVQILELMEGQSLTVKQVAEKLGLAPSKLYYHFGALEKLGLIEVAETRMVANMQEKKFRSNADLLDVDPALFNFSKEGDNEPINILLAFDFLDAPLDETLTLLGCIVFGIFGKIAMRARLGDRGNDIRPINGLHTLQFGT